MAGRLLTSVAVVVAVVHLSTAGGAATVKVSCEGDAVFGQRATLICFVDGSNSDIATEDGPVSFQWFKDGKPLAEDSSTLTILSAQLSDEGNYTCSMVPLNGPSLFSPVRIFNVLVPPEAVISQRADNPILAVAEGSLLNLTCHVTNVPKPRVHKKGYTWRVRHHKGGAPSVLAEKTKHLLTHTAHRNHTGHYDCEATNGVALTARANTDDYSIHVQVQYLDDFLTILPKEWQTVVAGDKVTLTCKADSIPTAKLTWLHQGRILRTVESNEDVYSFPATGCHDSGDYICKAENYFIKKSPHAHTKLIVECAPVLQADSTSPSRVPGYVGNSLTLTVSVTAHPAPSFLWSGPGLSSPVPQSPSLTLYNLQPQQAGIYTVNVSNSHGSLTRTFALDVIDPDKETPAAGGEMTLWLKVGGGVVAVLLCLAFVCLLLCRKRLFCSRGGKGDSPLTDERYYSGLHPPDGYNGAGRRRSQEVADYTSGGSTGHYWSIHSADLSWPQAVQPRDSLSQVSEEQRYDFPPPPVRVTSPGPPVFPHEEHEPSCDVLPTDDVSNSRHDVREGGTGDEASSLPWRYRRESGESEQASGDSEHYLSIRLVRHSLPPSTLAPLYSNPQDDYLTPVHMDVN